MPTSAVKARSLVTFFLFSGTLFSTLEKNAELSWHIKWCWLLGLSLLILTMSLKENPPKLYLPRIDGTLTFFALICLIGFFIHFVLNWPKISFVRLGERASFFVLFVYFLNVFREYFSDRQESVLPWILGLALIAFILSAALIWNEIAGDQSRVAVFPFFINRNMFTESLLSTSALLLICLPIDPTSFRTRILTFATIIINWIVAFHTSSRSALIIATLSLGSLCAVEAKRLKGFAKLPFWLAVIGILTILISNLNLMDPSFYVRLNLIENALVILADHPFGVGIGNFAWSELELPNSMGRINQVLFKSPHNEFLRLACEEGILTAVASYLFLIYWIAKARPQFATRNLIGYLFFVAFLSIETLFQFPFENPYTCLSLALAFALVRPRQIAEPVEFNWVLKLAVLGMILIVNTALFFKLQALFQHLKW